MADLPLLAAGLIITAVVVVWFLCALILILMILIQKGRGGGLSGAFGGMASGVLGSKTGDFMTWVTVILVFIFLTFSVVIAKYYKPTVRDSGTQPSVSQSQPQDVSQPLTGAEDAGTDSQGR